MGTAVRSGFPGPLRPGLIEASSVADRARSRPEFPGPLRPGLIEAPDIAACCAFFSPRFRGLCAPASLKRRNRSPPPAVRRRRFRGLCAPASLKPRTRRGPPHPHPRFPGPLRPGLIEAALDPVLPVAALPVFPGPLRPGLIEACEFGDRGLAISRCFRGLCAPASLKHGRADEDREGDQEQVSGAFAPRPH